VSFVVVFLSTTDGTKAHKKDAPTRWFR